MQLLQHDQLWALSRQTQAELLQEAEKVRMLRQAQAPKQPWWRSVVRLWQTEECKPLQADAAPEPR